MNTWSRWIALSVLATSIVWSLSGCGSNSQAPKGAETHEHKEGADKHADHKDGDHASDKEDEHAGHDHKDGGHGGALTERDVKMPDSFKAGIARLQQLHEQIEHLIEHGELPKVHRVAEEMALVAKKMKELARGELPEDKQTDAGRLCNEIASFYPPIDEAADAGKKAETEAIHKQMAATITKLKALVE